MYDIIGDVHGHASLLKKLLKQMGYRKGEEGYAHPERKAIFTGDFTNRGPEIRKTLRIIRRMVDSGAAYAILGNHEIYNILYCLKGNNNNPLLQNKKGKRYLSVQKTVEEFKRYPAEWETYISWLRTLPFFVEFDGLRVVHAAWRDSNIELIKSEIPPGQIRKKVFRDLVLQPHSALSQAILQTTRGVHLVMPPDLKIYDERRRLHRFFRVGWWQNPEGLTFEQWSFESKFRLPSYTIPPEIVPPVEAYPAGAPPVFFGHYCRGNGPWLIGDNICCVDACVSGTKQLVAYRWACEQVLTGENLLTVK